jgi:hypothetical protein
MAASVALKESLAAIGIAFVAKNPKATLKDFIDIFFTKSTKNYNEAVKKCEVQQKDRDVYVNTFPKPSDITIKNETVNHWYAIAFYTGRALLKEVGVSLSKYKILKVGENDSVDGYFLKSTCLKEIQNQHKNSNGKNSTLLKMNPDKFLIADVILYDSKSKAIQNLQKEINSNSLTFTKYVEIMSEEFTNKKVIPVSLKEINTKNPRVKFINRPSSISLKRNVEDEFYEELMILQRLATAGKKAEFLKRIENLIEIEFPDMNSQDKRWKVYFNFNYRKLKKKYFIWTNYASGGNSIHISETGTKSSSGEGGFTSQYFEKLSDQYTPLRKFFGHLYDLRIDSLKYALEKNQHNIQDVDDYMKSLNSKITKTFIDSSLKKMFYNSKYYIDFFKLMEISDRTIATDFYEEYSKQLTKNKKTYNRPEDTWILSSYEFGYFFSKHQQLIKEIVKHQVLITWMAITSGRGFITINRKKFSEKEFYAKELSQPAPYIKVGY